MRLRPTCAAIALLLVGELPAGAARLSSHLVGHFPLGGRPTTVTLADGGATLLVADRDRATVSIHDAATLKLVQSYPIEQVGHGVWQVLAISGGSELLLSNWMGQELRVLDRATGKLTASMPSGIKPSYVALSPDGRHAYAASLLSGTVALVDLEARATRREIKVGTRPMGVAASPDGRWLYVASCGSNKITKVDLKHEIDVEHWGAPLAETTNLAITPDGRYVLAAGDANRLLMVDTTSGDRVNVKVGGGPSAVALSPDGLTAFVAHHEDGTIGVVDLAAGALYATLEAGPGTMHVATGGTRLFAVNEGAGSLTVHELFATEAADVAPLPAPVIEKAVPPDALPAEAAPAETPAADPPPPGAGQRGDY